MSEVPLQVAFFGSALSGSRVRAHFVASMLTPDTLQPHIGCHE